MRQNLQHSLPPASDKIKYLFLEPDDAQREVADYAPFVYVEARVDFNDIRTGYRSMVSLTRAIELHPIGLDLSIVEDMVLVIDPHHVVSSPPDAVRFARLPEFVDTDFMSQMETLFIQYLINSFKAHVYRHFELDVYSIAGESLADFTARCMDLLGGPRREAQDALHEVFNRKLGQIGQKYLNDRASESFELIKSASQGRDVFSDYLERIAALFLQSNPAPNSESIDITPPQTNLELEERLRSLELEAQHAIAELWESYIEKARSVDEYILHPNLKDIHLVRSGIIWMPVRVA